MEPIKELGERIKTERIAKGYSVKSAAQGSGIARDTWRKIEAGGSVHDTKRHRAMEFLGLSEKNTEWGTVGTLEDHAADLTGVVDFNLMFSQAVRFTATIGLVVPEVRDDAERLTVALSDLFARGLELWDRRPFDERDDLFGGEEPIILSGVAEGGDGNADADAGGSASTIEFIELDAEVEVREADRSTRRRGAPE